MSSKITPYFLMFLFISVSNAQDKLLKQSFFFEHDSYKLTYKHKQIIDSLNTVFVNDSIKIEIKGYTNSLGAKAYNLKLSNKRALSIKKAFLDSIDITARGYGELENSLSKNRRVDVLISIFENQNESKTDFDRDILKSDDEIEVGDVFRLNGILFQGGKDIFLEESFSELKKLLAFMKDNNYKIKLLGHICCTTDGSEGINLRTNTQSLSLDRAKAVFKYLVNNGIDGSRMSYVGLAGNYPTGKDIKYDRRVEIEIISLD